MTARKNENRIWINAHLMGEFNRLKVRGIIAPDTDLSDFVHKYLGIACAVLESGGSMVVGQPVNTMPMPIVEPEPERPDPIEDLAQYDDLESDD